jgi:hypothetical protein
MEMKLRRQLKHDRRAIGARLDKKDRYMSSLQNQIIQFSKPDSPVFTEKIYAQNIV